VTSTLRTAGCGPARPVVWEGPDGANPVSPYPIASTPYPHFNGNEARLLRENAVVLLSS